MYARRAIQIRHAILPRNSSRERSEETLLRSMQRLLGNYVLRLAGTVALGTWDWPPLRARTLKLAISLPWLTWLAPENML